MKAKYIRVSTTEQNTDRQLDFDGAVYIDEVSGSVAFKEREFAQKLLANKEITEVRIFFIFTG